MRFRKGTKVEVLRKQEEDMGAWRCAEIISGNGHTYLVKYGSFPAASDVVMERVPRKAMRPCPPSVRTAGNWVPGDLVEVFCSLSWKTALVVKVMGENNVMVRLLLSAKEFVLHKCYVRVRQCWRDGRWFIAGQGLDMCMGKRQPGAMVKFGVKGGCFQVGKNINLQNPCMVSARPLKRRSSHISCGLEVLKKSRMIRKDGSRLRICSFQSSPSSEKVEEIVYPNGTVGENCMNYSFPIGPDQSSRMDVDEGTNCSFSKSTTSVDSDSCASSVGSCSAMVKDAYDIPFRFSTTCNKNTEDYCSDAESSNRQDYEEEGCSLLSDEVLVFASHRSELDAYHAAIMTLYTSGPLSWEDEGKLTNLRLALHISDDEHLMFLRNLMPANSALLIS